MAPVRGGGAGSWQSSKARNSRSFAPLSYRPAVGQLATAISGPWAVGPISPNSCAPRCPAACCHRTDFEEAFRGCLVTKPAEDRQLAGSAA